MAHIDDEIFGTLNSQMDIDTQLEASVYVNRVIKYAENLFRQDRGRQDTKRANLGDIRSTKIRTPEVLQKPIYNCSEDQKATTYVHGNIKAIVPLFRERLSCDEASTNNVNMVRFKRGDI